MKYAIFSDIHANLPAWNQVYADIQNLNADVLICLGDVVGYGPRPQEVLDGIRAATNHFVLGNHDAAAAGIIDPKLFNQNAQSMLLWTRESLTKEALDFFQQVPLELESGKILFVHAEIAEPGRFGYIENTTDAATQFAARDHFVTFVGHTHHPEVFEHSAIGVRSLGSQNCQLDPNNRYIINVGSVGEPRNPEDLRACYVIYDDNTNSITYRRLEFDVNVYRSQLRSTSLTNTSFFIQMLEKEAGAKAKTEHDMRIPAHAVKGVMTPRHTLNFPTPPNTIRKSKPAAPPPSKQTNIAPLILIPLLAVVLIGGGLFWFVNSSNDKTANHSLTSTNPTVTDSVDVAENVPDQKDTLTHKTPKPEPIVIAKTKPTKPSTPTENEPDIAELETEIATPPPREPIEKTVETKTPEFIDLIPVSSLEQPFHWRFSYHGGKENYAWSAVDYDDSTWKVVPGRFLTKPLTPAEKETSTEIVAGKNVFGRREFILEQLPTQAQVYVQCRGSNRVGVNGQKLLLKSGSPEGQWIHIKKQLLANFKIGTNVIGFKCEPSQENETTTCGLRLKFAEPNHPAGQDYPMELDELLNDKGEYILRNGWKRYKDCKNITITTASNNPKEDSLLLYTGSSDDLRTVKRSLIFFDLDIFNTIDKNPESTTLSLAITNPNEVAIGTTIAAYAITKENAGWNQSENTWQNKGQEAWSGGAGLGAGPGKGFSSKVAGAIQYKGDSIINIPIEKAFVDYWFDNPEWNAGLIIITEERKDQQIIFHSDQSAERNLRPTLKLKYESIEDR